MGKKLRNIIWRKSKQTRDSRRVDGEIIIQEIPQETFPDRRKTVLNMEGLVEGSRIVANKCTLDIVRWHHWTSTKKRKCYRLLMERVGHFPKERSLNSFAILGARRLWNNITSQGNGDLSEHIWKYKVPVSISPTFCMQSQTLEGTLKIIVPILLPSLIILVFLCECMYVPGVIKAGTHKGRRCRECQEGC